MSPVHSEQLRTPKPTLQDGERLRQARLNNLLNVTQAAKQIGIDRRHLQRMERETASASDLMIRRCAKTYGVRHDELRKQSAAA